MPWCEIVSYEFTKCNFTKLLSGHNINDTDDTGISIPVGIHLVS